MNGKGDKRRPMSISQSQYESRWKEIFSAFEFVDKIKGDNLKKKYEKSAHSMKNKDKV